MTSLINIQIMKNIQEFLNRENSEDDEKFIDYLNDNYSLFSNPSPFHMKPKDNNDR